MPIEVEKFTPLNVLVIMPHPDDIEFGVVGSVARWIAAGASVTYCIVTDGSAGSNIPNADLEALIEQRRQEAILSAAIVGVTDLRFLEYQDGILEPTMGLRKDLTRLIRQIKPDRVVAFDPTCYIERDANYVNHPDHRASGEATLYAVFPSAGTRPIFPDLLAEGYEPHDVSDLYLVLTDHATTYVDISAHMEQKLDALRCHKTQFGEDVVQLVKGWNSEAGKKFGCEYAEVFRVVNFRPEQPKE
jgi:LmbE family N-acetylglucosaminyl deacetylase